MKLKLLLTLITFWSIPAAAQDNEFGASFTGQEPTGLSQPSPSVLAKYQDNSVAQIEPASGDEEVATPEAETPNKEQDIGMPSEMPEPQDQVK